MANMKRWYSDVDWIMAEFEAIPEPNIQDRLIACGLLAAQADELD